MILVDHEITVFLRNAQITDNTEQTAVFDGSPDCITNIGYDLRANGFIVNGECVPAYELLPGASVFVESVEIVRFDNSTCGIVNIKNSRIRMGLSVESPVYQPGHQTRIYFRLTNLSDKTVLLEQGAQYAFLMFEQLSGAPEKPYAGTFQNEQQYKGLAAYESWYETQTKAVEKKARSLKDIEKSIYGNVITILTIFIAIFSIINVNVDMAQTGSVPADYLLFNASILGAVSFLAALLFETTGQGGRNRHCLWIAPVVCFIAVIISIIIL